MLQSIIITAYDQHSQSLLPLMLFSHSETSDKLRQKLVLEQLAHLSFLDPTRLIHGVSQLSGNSLLPSFAENLLNFIYVTLSKNEMADIVFFVSLVVEIPQFLMYQMVYYGVSKVKENIFPFWVTTGHPFNY